MNVQFLHKQVLVKEWKSRLKPGILCYFMDGNRELTKNKHERVWTEAEMYKVQNTYVP